MVAMTLSPAASTIDMFQMLALPCAGGSSERRMSWAVERRRGAAPGAGRRAVPPLGQGVAKSNEVTTGSASETAVWKASADPP